VLRSKERDDLVTQLATAQRRVAELEAELARRALRDPLVGNALTLPAFRTQLDAELRRSQRYRRPLTVAIVDLDAFAGINDERGYATGDAVLAAVGDLIDRATRITDVTCRVGADEFALLLPETDAEAAEGAGQRVLAELEAFESGDVHGLSASIGLCEYASGQSPDDILNAARQAVLEARAHGGGRIAVWAGRPPVADDPQRGGGDVAAALAAALEERDTYTGEHSESVVELTARVAEALGLGGAEVSRVRMAALLHDIGKVGIPDEILNKPGPLDEREWEIMRQHPVIGERILRAIPGLGSIARVVRHEHERWDGDGYPDGLKGNEIPLEARIILACDAYHAMVSDRPYRRAMPHADAIAELSRNAGTQFDPEVVEMLIGYLYGRRQSGRSL
jgi:diguanylate cyclase (GGDEF)-like protein/putative nucleotidyltransferase with HDIG domain